ncbi:MAG: DUF4192 family protein [Actinobacteria bacterium]|nr:DUF4192 family protein [Actinomycetota bacterium]
MKNNLLLDDQLSKINEINYEDDDVLKQQRLGAIAVNQLVANFALAKHEDDPELIALVLVRLKDLQVRDYAMGLVSAENIDQQFNLWYWLMSTAPKGYIAPVACIFAACAYESGESDMAHKALDNAFADQISYPLAVLLRRVFFSGWPAHSFAAMRSELHPKICASLFGGSI